MTDDSGSEGTRKGLSLPRAGTLAFGAFLFLLILGVGFYLWWGISYNGWTDNGVYAVTITLVAFGLAGMKLTMPRAAASPPAPHAQP